MLELSENVVSNRKPVALNILSIAVTSVPNERTFSTVGNLITK